MITMSFVTVCVFMLGIVQFIAGAYFIGKAHGIKLVMKERKAIELAEPDVEIIPDIAPIVMRYRELATNAAVIHGTKHDYVFLWCKDGVHHGMNVKPGDGSVLVQLLGLKPLTLPSVAFGGALPHKPNT